ncbi:MAG: DUF6165 family protein [Rhodospirillaceae bacterium]|nr:DUF6165 family protein [Rhodospirillaceae bacterium]
MPAKKKSKTRAAPKTSTTPLVPISVGELVDKITILEIKRRHIADAAKRRNVATELRLLSQVLSRLKIKPALIKKERAGLVVVNGALWEIEDKIRDCERAKDFGPTFVELARAVYVTNDKRAALKRAINDRVGSALIEEKSYADYT